MSMMNFEMDDFDMGYLGMEYTAEDAQQGQVVPRDPNAWPGAGAIVTQDAAAQQGWGQWAPPPEPPPPAQEDQDAARLQQAVLLHPLYPRLLDAIISCRKVGQASRHEIVELDNRCRRAKAEAAAARDTAFRQGGLPAEVNDPELHEYMTRFVAAAEQHRAQLAALYQDVEAAARNMEVQVNQLLCGGQGNATDGGSSGGAHSSGSKPPATPSHHEPPFSPASHTTFAPGTHSGGGGGTTYSGAGTTLSVGGSVARGDTSGSATSTASGVTTNSRDDQTEALRTLLKRQYADTITQLQEEFTRKRSKGKLPKDATSTLRDWWNKHYAWPYPKDDDKEVLSGASGLSVTQVNNWFINQRKRHWHKLFQGFQPNNEQEATQYLKATGQIV